MVGSNREAHQWRMWMLVIAILHWVCFFLMVHATTAPKSAEAPAWVSNFAQGRAPSHDVVMVPSNRTR